MRHVTRPAVALLRFLGATETVTGSRFLVDTPHARVLVEWGYSCHLAELAPHHRLRESSPLRLLPPLARAGETGLRSGSSRQR